MTQWPQTQTSHREALKVLAGDNEQGVRSWVATNSACPPEQLSHLARDEDHGVRSSVAKNPACPSELLVKLSGD